MTKPAEPESTTQQSIPNEPERLSELPRYTSAVLQQIKSTERPNPSPACETCPASLWFMGSGTASDKGLQCFCTRMHAITWQRQGQPIMLCDGRELALLALEAG